MAGRYHSRMFAFVRRLFAVLLMLGVSLQAVQAAAPLAACADATAAGVVHTHDEHAARYGDAAAEAIDAAEHCDAATHMAAHQDGAGPTACDHCQHCGVGHAALMPAIGVQAAEAARAERLLLPHPAGWASITPEPLHRPPIERAA